MAKKVRFDEQDLNSKEKPDSAPQHKSIKEQWANLFHAKKQQIKSMPRLGEWKSTGPMPTNTNIPFYVKQQKPVSTIVDRTRHGQTFYRNRNSITNPHMNSCSSFLAKSEWHTWLKKSTNSSLPNWETAV